MLGSLNSTSLPREVVRNFLWSITLFHCTTSKVLTCNVAKLSCLVKVECKIQPPPLLYIQAITNLQFFTVFDKMLFNFLKSNGDKIIRNLCQIGIKKDLRHSSGKNSNEIRHNILLCCRAELQESPQRSFNPVISCENVPVNQARAKHESFRHGVDFITVDSLLTDTSIRRTPL